MRFRYATEENGRLVKRAVVYTREEHGIKLTDVDVYAIDIVSRLKSFGYETYIVGGAVRDLMMGKKPKDFDIVSAANPAKIKKVFRNARIIGRRFRLVHVYFGPKIYEVSTFRSLKDGHTSNTFGTIEEDALRRDFTLNAFFYDPGTETVVDYVNGMKDFKAGRIRPIIPLDLIFKDDPVRMLRAAKYAATTGFKIPFSLRMRIKKDSCLLAGISPSRITEEITKIINSAHAREIVKSMDELGLYGYIQNEAHRLMRLYPDFKNRYLASMAAYNGSAAVSPQGGEAHSCLIRDYLDDLVDWSLPGSETYKEALAGARDFVRPMNPPRVELEKAVRLVFREHGITIKKTYGVERHHAGKGRTAEKKGESAKEAERQPSRRKRKRSGPPAAE